jgi:uncharacterized protein involved in response to NO
MANAALLLVGLIGGRVVPSFTLNALRRAGTPVEIATLPWLDRAAMLSLAAVVAIDLAAPDGQLAGLAAALAAVLVAGRLSRWHGLRTLDTPLLWVLHLGYALVAVALALKASFLLGRVGFAAAWLHMQLAGALGMMIVAVMSRATLGHTGRDLVAAPATAAAYAALLLAALARVFGTALSDDPMLGYAVAAVLWVAAFGLFLAVHAPMLVLPRTDGKPG